MRWTTLRKCLIVLSCTRDDYSPQLQRTLRKQVESERRSMLTSEEALAELHRPSRHRAQLAGIRMP